MKLNPMLLGALIAVFGTSGALAAAHEKKEQDASGTGTPQAVKQPFETLDTDNDGTLGPVEAMADRDAGSKFEELDTNNDRVLSREEYAAWTPEQAGPRGGEPKNAN